MKNKTIFFNKWPSTRLLDAYLAKSLGRVSLAKLTRKFK